MTKKVSAATLSTIKARLDPTLNEPYFSESKSGGGCLHLHYGVRLDETTQRAYCKKCGVEIALFTALWNYHHAEQRLVRTLEDIKRREQAEIDKKAREKERRPFLRAVSSRKAVKDMSLKAEPTIGFELTLECGHVVDSKNTRHLSNVTCHECKNDAMVAAAKARKP